MDASTASPVRGSLITLRVHTPSGFASHPQKPCTRHCHRSVQRNKVAGMSVWRIMGTETEYGISVPGNPGANAMLISSQIVNSYAAAMHRARRARGDFEEENTLRDGRGVELAAD